MKTSEEKSAANRSKKEYRKTHPNGRVAGFLDENDRLAIKTYCKPRGIQAIVDLEKNTCHLYVIKNANKLCLGTIQKVVYQDTFVLLSPFSYFPNRNIKPGEKPARMVVAAGSAVIVDSEDKQKVWIEAGEECVKMDRWVMAKSANIRQLYSLFLTNPEEGIGAGEGQYKIDIMTSANIPALTTKIRLCTL